MTAWRFTTEERDGRFYIFRSGAPLGSVCGYETKRLALEAIEQTKRWDRIVDGDQS